jgi:hypothetical protein
MSELLYIYFVFCAGNSTSCKKKLIIITIIIIIIKDSSIGGLLPVPGPTL